MAIKVEYTNDSYGLTYTDSKGNEEYVFKGKAFEIVGISKDVDTEEVHYVVESDKLGEVNQFIIPKADAIDSKQVLKYSEDGLDVTSSTCKIITEVFQQKEDEYIDAGGKVGEVFSVLGVKDAIVDGVATKVFAGAINPCSNASYIGHLNVVPAGSATEWFAFIKGIVKNSVALMFVIAAGFASILLAVLEGYIDVDNFIIHLFGFSSSGKTTALYLAASIFGSPDVRCGNGLISSWNGTKNALLRRLMNVNGVMLGLDEFSMSNEKNVTSLVYAISEGKERERLSRDARLLKCLSGTYIVMSTGECSIYSKTNGNLGLTVRILEMQDIAWTESAEQSENIKRFVKGNYGHGAVEFGKKLAEWLAGNSLDALFERYEEWRKYYCAMCTFKARMERMGGRYALIILAADLLNEWFGFEMDCKALTKFLIDNESNSGNNRDSYDDVYDKLVACIRGNYNHFSHCYTMKGKLEAYKATEEWGIVEYLHDVVKVDGTDSKMLVLITAPYFDKIVSKDLGYEDSKAIRKWLKSKGYTKCEDGHDYYRKVFDGIRNKYVALYLPGEASDFEQTDLEWDKLQ